MVQKELTVKREELI